MKADSFVFVDSVQSLAHLLQTAGLAPNISVHVPDATLYEYLPG